MDFQTLVLSSFALKYNFKNTMLDFLFFPPLTPK